MYSIYIQYTSVIHKQIIKSGAALVNTISADVENLSGLQCKVLYGIKTSKDQIAR